MSGRLEGRIAFVTGAGSGIGRATGIRLAEDGATVIATSRNLAHAEGTRDEIAAAGLPPAEAIELDVADSHQVDRVIGEVAARHGRIDVAVANAGVELLERRASRRPPTTSGTACSRSTCGGCSPSADRRCR
jgi:NAD(P)-dependent dehydrogenase (short-subunit alcohol dehydrogenase family)